VATGDGVGGLRWRHTAKIRYGAEDAQLTAFHYFAVADTTDLSVLKWRRGGGCVSVEHARFMAERFRLRRRSPRCLHSRRRPPGRVGRTSRSMPLARR
jgi:hypothetical protein